MSEFPPNYYVIDLDDDYCGLSILLSLSSYYIATLLHSKNKSKKIYFKFIISLILGL